MGEPVSKLLEWGGGPPEDQAVSGSVIEFAFGLEENSYLATSYPHRPHLADKHDVRTVNVLNMPFVLEKIELLKPRYIMNVAIRDSVTWFMFCYRGERFAYDSKWFPRKPLPTKSDPIGMQLRILKEDERDQISYCAFGESNDCYFLRSTDILKIWHPRFSNNMPMQLLSTYQDEAFRAHLRAVTFGKNQTWILYGKGKSTFNWSKHGLPKSLKAALQKGKEEGWIINKAVLSRRNNKEYVLVYDHGPVYYYFHREFIEMFQTVIREWSNGMRASGRYPEHDPTLNYGHDDDDDDEYGVEMEAEDIESEDENEPYQIKHDKSPRQKPDSRHSSSQSQPRPIVPSPPSSRPNSSAPNAAGGVLQHGFNVRESKEVFEDIPSTAQGASANVILPRSSRSVTSPERVPNQPVVPRADYGLEGQSYRPDSIPTHTSAPSSRPKKSRGTSKSEAIKMIRRGVKDLLS